MTPTAASVSSPPERGGLRRVLAVSVPDSPILVGMHANPVAIDLAKDLGDADVPPTCEPLGIADELDPDSRYPLIVVVTSDTVP